MLIYISKKYQKKKKIMRVVTICPLLYISSTSTRINNMHFLEKMFKFKLTNTQQSTILLNSDYKQHFDYITTADE